MPLRIIDLWGLLPLILFACGKREIEPTTLGAEQYAYYPLEVGKYVEYQIDSVVYDFGPGGGTIQDASRTFAKEIVTDTLRDHSGVLFYLIERYEKGDEHAANGYIF